MSHRYLFNLIIVLCFVFGTCPATTNNDPNELSLDIATLQQEPESPSLVDIVIDSEGSFYKVDLEKKAITVLNIDPNDFNVVQSATLLDDDSQKNLLQVVIQADIATDYIKLKKVSKELLSTCQSDKQFIVCLDAIATEYNFMRNHQQASKLYEYILASPLPDDDSKTLAQIGKITSQICLNDYPDNIQEEVNALISNYSDSPYLEKAISMVAERYYIMAQQSHKTDQSAAHKAYLKAIDLWQTQIQKFPDSERTPDCIYYMGITFQQIEDYKKAINHFRLVVDKYPMYQRSWHALYTITQCYDSMQKQDALDQTTANEFRNAVWKEILEKYPDCSVTNIARKKVKSDA